MMHRTNTAVACMMLMLILEPMRVTSVVTSYEQLRHLAANGDKYLVQSIEDAIQEKLDAVRTLTKILTEHMKNQEPPFQLKANHPNDFFLLVKHHVTSWLSGNDSAVLEELIENGNITFPTTDDANDADRALVRLQFVYKLKARDMFEGNYLGYQGSPLDISDAYALGNAAVQEGFPTLGMEWLNLSADLLEKALESQSQASGSKKTALQKEYITTLSVMGLVYLYMNNTEMARKLYDKCNASEFRGIEDVEVLGQELSSEEPLELYDDADLGATEEEQNVSVLCSRDKDHRVSAVRPYHVCRYKTDVLIPYHRFREELLSTSPYVSIFYDVIHDSEIVWLKSLANKKIQRARVFNGSHNIVSKHRTGDLSWIKDADDRVTARVSRRVQAFTRLNTISEDDTFAEHLQLLNYGMAGHYDVHFDSTTETEDEYFDHRLATVILYLSDVEKGGATVFPRIGISVSPVKGTALFWYNVEPDLIATSQLTRHAGCPVMIGNKWIANKWIHCSGNTFRRPCGPSPTSQQLDVEKLVTVGPMN